MSDDPFAFHVQRLTNRHRSRHTPATVAEVTLQRWLVLRRRFNDPFDAALFDQIDAALTRMPAGIDTADSAPAPVRRGRFMRPRGDVQLRPVGRRP